MKQINQGIRLLKNMKTQRRQIQALSDKVFEIAGEGDQAKLGKANQQLKRVLREFEQTKINFSAWREKVAEEIC